MLPLIIPVFLGAFKRADELALAMEARGYRIKGKQVKEKSQV
jgi:energy-coupling factor transport system permease protein